MTMPRIEYPTRPLATVNIRSRMTSKLQESPNVWSAKLIGQSDRRVVRFMSSLA